VTIEEWGAIGEIVGALAVVASLVYLAAQIRQNTRQLSLSVKATELAAFERNVESGNLIRSMFIQDPKVAELYTRGIRDFKALDETDRLRFEMLLSNMFSALQGAYIRQLTYTHDPDGFEGGKRAIDRLLSLRGVRQWLRLNDPDWRPEFAALVEERAALVTEKNPAAR
jgi:hypothetical protein